MQLSEKIQQAEHSIEAAEDQQFDHIHFTWENIDFKASTRAYDDNACYIDIQADLGRLFYTIENTADRTMGLERIYSTNRVIDGSYKIDRNGRVSFKNATRTQTHTKGKELLSAVTVILMEAEPHLRSIKSHLK